MNRRNRNIEGTGLGMSITIQLLSLMGSKLQVESVYGKGSRFYFELDNATNRKVLRNLLNIRANAAAWLIARGNN